MTGHFRGILQEPLLERFRFLRFRQLRLKVLLQMTDVIPFRIAERAARTIDERQPPLHEGAARDRLKQRRIGLELGDVLEDRRRLHLSEGSKASFGVEKCTDVAERRLFVEGGPAAAIQHAGVQHRVGCEFQDLRESQNPAVRIDRRNDVLARQVLDVEVTA